MAAFSAARAPNGGSVVSGAARHSLESSGEETASQNLDVGPATVLEFFQMCDVENKGFITQRDMQVRVRAAVEDRMFR